MSHRERLLGIISARLLGEDFMLHYLRDGWGGELPPKAAIENENDPWWSSSECERLCEELEAALGVSRA